MNKARTCAVLGLYLLAVTPPILAAQAVGSPVASLAELLADLRNGTAIRLTSNNARWTGRLTAQSQDSLTLADETGTRSIQLAAIDSMWVRGHRAHRGLLAGAGFGALMFGALQLGGESSEDPGLNTQLGLTILAASLAAGLVVDAISDRWVQRYPKGP